MSLYFMLYHPVVLGMALSEVTWQYWLLSESTNYNAVHGNFQTFDFYDEVSVNVLDNTARAPELSYS